MMDAAFLNCLRPQRRSVGVPRPMLAQITGLHQTYLGQIERCEFEPYLAEAALIARALCTPGITPLITEGTLAECDLGIPLPSDMLMLRAGFPLPLSLACRLTLKFGLTDPEQLLVSTLDHTLWEVMQAGERGSAPGACPWCAEAITGDLGHLPTCLPHNLWGPRGHDRVAPGALTARSLPYRPGKGRRSSGMAKNLRTIREAAGENAKDLCYRIGERYDYYLRIERLELPLTLDKAKKIAGALGVDIALLYAPAGTTGPDDPEPKTVV